ncbi:UbiA family prenyltransferase [Ochrobactrum vermis]|uniref:heme o synthase n=1 Tax=Ochrobactrum vermis TaxID=1827297 RepID=A0ABU8PL60_9HYPH|nr:UbiA family prenyltransferase [Ochrobactrum vermis]
MRVADFFELTKPRIMALAVFTALTGYVASSSSIDITHLRGALLFIAVGTGGTGAFNRAFARRSGAVMRRTSARRTATGKITPAAAIVITAAITAVGVFGLFLIATVLAAALLAFAIILLRSLQHPNPETSDVAEYRDRRRSQRAFASHRPGGGFPQPVRGSVVALSHHRSLNAAA